MYRVSLDILFDGFFKGAESSQQGRFATRQSVRDRRIGSRVLFMVSILMCCCAKSTRSSDWRDADASVDSSINDDARVVLTISQCGNGLIEPGERCDDGNHEDGDTCSGDCLSIDVCPQGVLEGSLIIPNRNDVGINDLAECNRITGSLLLNEIKSTNLDELQKLHRVEGDLIIGPTDYSGNFDAYYDSELTDIKGLSSLVTVDGDFVIFGNPNLTSLEGLENLESVGGDFVLKSNALSSLRPLDNLTRVGGSLYLAATFDEETLVGTASLTVVGGDLIISHNFETYGPTFSEERGLEVIVGFEALKKIGGDLLITWNHKLRDLDAFNELETIGGDFAVTGSEVSVWRSFENLSSIGGDVYIWANDLLESLLLQPVPNTIGGRVFIWENEILPTCEALSFEEVLRANGFTGEIVICENQEDECGSQTCADNPFPDWDTIS